MPCYPAISSHSLGRAWVHDLPSKLDQAARIGFDLELFYEDLSYIADKLTLDTSDARLRAAAKMVRSMCDERGLAIVCLQPFMHYEGLRDRQRHQQRVEEMRLWIDLARILRTDIIAIPSTFLSAEETTGDIDTIVADFRAVADLGAPHDIRFSYESLAWGTHVDTWEQCWDVVRRVDRPNFGICLDTFNIAARVYADPAAESGRNENAEERMRASLQRMASSIDVEKIVWVQVVDAERLEAPLREGHAYYDASQPARMSWSRNCRLFYGEEDRGAYLPVKEVLHTILVDLGFEGCLAAELFSRTLTDSSENVPREHADRAATSWRKLVQDFNLKEQTKRIDTPLQEMIQRGSDGTQV
ncbi:hypothetical protein MBLNU230_g4242t1 [Neophaeotheca triangularis]